MGDSIDLTAIFNEVNTIASIAATSTGGSLVHGASALPRNAPDQCQWPGQTGELPPINFDFDSWASDHGIASPTRSHIGGSWEFGGNVNGAGLFLKSVSLVFSVDSIGLGQSFDLSGNFDDPTYVGDPKSPIAQITAHLHITHNYVRMQMETFNIDVTVKGDGGHSFRQV